MHLRNVAWTGNCRIIRACAYPEACRIAMRPGWAIAAVLGVMMAMTLPAPCTAQAVAQPAGKEGVLQLVQPLEPGQTSPHLTITLEDALERAQKNDTAYTTVVTDAKLAREDQVQARAAGLPSVSALTSALLTQGNGKIPTGRFVTNDGVHVYNQWGVLHQDFSMSTLTMAGDRRGAALEAVARAKVEIAQRGLKVTVTKNYYALIVSQRKYATAQEGLRRAQDFLNITSDQEKQGQVAHSDVIKAQIQFNQQRTAVEEAQLQMEKDRLTVAVLIFANFTENFSLVDDLDEGAALPAFSEVQGMAESKNPDLRAAVETLKASNVDVSMARSALLPSVTADLVYGIQANAYALRSKVSSYPEVGPVPNLGYFFTITMNLPVWDWGNLHSKLRQAEYRRQQARADLTMAQRQIIGGLYSAYDEAQTAAVAVTQSRETADLGRESLRLTMLRYQAGQALALEVVDAETTYVQARNAYDDAQARYRLALAQLQTVTGPF